MTTRTIIRSVLVSIVVDLTGAIHAAAVPNSTAARLRPAKRAAKKRERKRVKKGLARNPGPATWGRTSRVDPSPDQHHDQHGRDRHEPELIIRGAPVANVFAKKTV